MAESPLARWKLLGLRPLRLGLRLMWDAAPGWTVVQVVLLVVQGLIPLAALYLTKLIVDAVLAGVGAAAGAGGAMRLVDALLAALGNAQPDALGRVLLLIAAAGAVAALGIAIRTATTLVGEVQSLRLTDRMHDVLHAKSVAVDLEYYERPSFHDSLHRAQAEAPYRPARIVHEMAQVAQNGISLLAIIGLLFSFHWSLPLILFAAALPGMAVKVRFSRQIYNWALRQTAANRKSRYLNQILTSRAFAKEVRLFDLGELFMERFRELRTQVREEKLGIVRRRSLMELAAQLVAVAAVFGSFAFIAVRALAGTITVGDMVMYFGAFQRAQDFFRDALGGLAGLYEDNMFLADLDMFLALSPRLREPAAPVPLPRAMRHGITIENVSFTYPGSHAEVLSDINFEIRAGEHVALVGENGSGKTTLVKLLCRLYDPTAGTIRIDGIDLRDLSIRELRRYIGIIFQDYARYDLTVRDNIWMGDVALPQISERIMEAARRTGADAVIAALPRGYDTLLGREFGEGAELSIGQWQKVALARAFLRDSPILVLDEPTAALDPRAEAEVFERFHEQARARTAVLISHRLSTVKMADRIFVLQNGRIVEAGDHAELVGRGGTYAELFEMQAKHYR
jgi:ATP-binding cassette subfamily B protein